jgi:signal transduction histidine kinase
VALAESAPISKLFALVARRLKKLLDPQVVQVWTIGPDGRGLEVAFTQVEGEERLAELVAHSESEDLGSSEFTSAEAVRRGEIVIRRASEPLPDRIARLLAEGGIEMSLSVPIVASERVHGAVNLMFRAAREFDAGDLRFLEAVGATIAAAIENANLLERVLRERRWLGTILDELPIPILLAEGEGGTFLRTNQAFQRLFGSVEGLQVEEYWDRFRFEDPVTGAPIPSSERPLARALRDNASTSVEVVHEGADGVRRTLVLRGAPLLDPRYERAAILAVHDITDARELERQSYRQAQLLHLTFDNVPAGIAVLDAESLCFVQVNENFARLFRDPRITRDALVGRAVTDVYPDFASTALATILHRVRDTRTPFNAAAFELEGGPHGSTWWNISLLPLEADADVENLLLFAVDVTPLVETERRLRAALADAETGRVRLEEINRELLEALRVKDEFLSTLSHELRTPLTPILGWTRILKAHGGDADLLAQALRAIERNVLAQVRLVDDLLDLSRLAYDRLRLERERLAVDAVLRDALERVRSEAEARKIGLQFEPGAGAVPVHADPVRLLQVFGNLVENAVKFSEEGGRVEVRSRVRDGGVEVEVHDHGVGIEPEFLPRVFERFQQAEVGTTRRHGGLGIGLSIAKSLTELHGGTIAAESEGHGKGSTFRVWLPGADTAAAAAAGATAVVGDRDAGGIPERARASGAAGLAAALGGVLPADGPSAGATSEDRGGAGALDASSGATSDAKVLPFREGPSGSGGAPPPARD